MLFPNITSIKRQMQRQERTGHFHVNYKEEWNMFHDGVNHRVQSKRHYTRLAAMTQVFHRNRKKISQGTIGPHNTRKQLWTDRNIEQKISLSIMFDPCVIPKHHKHKTPDAETGENRSFPCQPQRGVEYILRWCTSSNAEQPTIYTRHTARTQVFHRSREKISQGSIGPYNTPKQQ